MSESREAFERLCGAATTGELGVLCRRFGVTLLVVFGSAVRPDGTPRDLDIAVRFSNHSDVLGFLDQVGALAGTMRVDLMNLDRAGPVAREQALVGGVALFEEPVGAFAREQMAAITERMDTDWLRRLELEQLAR
ncbi:hypothetical protein F0L68_14425 [Solihabitans fulvus]|uniref:Polymerase beta nucleotidyltransferase domain-containing protein n=1 Tax=Solihabitans fulvus TaxID=1892852 RepID=A0A5B2XDY3_9PSEU|nr:hypothetical protein [Solihabitans fulvus]KAA2261907.1 hypothetical protein F0L68_14425 [Solihabitans fulvus]